MDEPDGSPVDDYWRIVRARPQILRLEYGYPGRGFRGRRHPHGTAVSNGKIAEHVTCTVGEWPEGGAR
jgi:hypothetical protein